MEACWGLSEVRAKAAGAIFPLLGPPKAQPEAEGTRRAKGRGEGIEPGSDMLGALAGLPRVLLCHLERPVTSPPYQCML